MIRQEAIDIVSNRISSIDLPYPVCVSVDGFAAAGKTSLARELELKIQETGRPVLNISVDGFHNTKEIRYQKGSMSPQGYYDDSFNYKAIVENVLIPLSPNGNRKFKPVIFDFRTNSHIEVPFQSATNDTILLFEGLFLQRPELKNYWNLNIFVQTDHNVSLSRAIKRDLELFKTPEVVTDKYENRYIPGHKIYQREEQPEGNSDILVINNDIENPELIFNNKHK